MATRRRELHRVLGATCALLGVLGCGGDAPPAPRAPAPEPAPIPAPVAPPAYGPPHAVGMSYDEALAVPEDMSSVAAERELTDAELSQPLQSPAFLSSCGVQDSTHVRVRVVIRDGAAVGVTVLTAPDDPSIAECVGKGVRAVAWPANKRRDSLTTTY